MFQGFFFTTVVFRNLVKNFREGLFNKRVWFNQFLPNHLYYRRMVPVLGTPRFSSIFSLINPINWWGDQWMPPLLYHSPWPPFCPLKTYFLKIPENMLKFGNFPKSRFLGVRGGNVISNPQKWFHIHIVWGHRMPFFQNFEFWKMWFLSFGGHWRIP